MNAEFYLNLQTNSLNNKLDNEQKAAVIKAMHIFAKKVVVSSEQKKRRWFTAILLGQVKLLTYKEFINFLRVKMLNWEKRIVQKMSNANNRKYYIIRKSLIGYTHFSSSDVKTNKKLRIFEKDVDVLKLHEIADAVIYPKKKP